MPELQYSQFGTDFNAIVAGIVAACRAAWDDVPRVFPDRTVIEERALPYAVIVPTDISMSVGQDNTLKTVLQSFEFAIYLVEAVTPGMDVLAHKVTRCDDLIAELMADIRFLDTYELPIVPSVTLAEDEPNPNRMVTAMMFRCQCLNWKHADLTP